MKIAIDVRNVGRGRTGSEVVVVQLTRALLVQNGGRDEFFLLTDTDDEGVIAQIRRVLELDVDTDGKNAQIVSLGVGGEFAGNKFVNNKFVWAALHVWRWLRVNPVDVYHTEYILPFFAPRSVKLVTHIHDVSFAALPQFIKWRDLIFLRSLIPWSLRKADAVIAISEFTRSEIIKYYSVAVPDIAEKLHLVPNAVGEEFRRKASDEEIARVRAKYDLPQKYIFSLGTMQPRKNIGFLIRAFGQIADKIPGVDLVLSGRRAYNFDGEIDGVVEGVRVRFTGYIEAGDLVAVYAGARAFAFPSLYEGFGLPILEAMSQGVPVVASDIPVFREVAGDDGALFASAASSDDLAQFGKNLYTITVDEGVRNELVTIGQARVGAYSWQVSAELLRNVFAQKIKQKDC